jgi:alkyl hydroperoxide reductase subunit F
MEFPGIILDTAAFSRQKQPDTNTVYDMLIIGGGAAAMSAAVYAARKMIKLAILTVDFGGLINETSEIENYLGFQNINAADLAARFEEHVKGFDLPVSIGKAVKEIRKKDGTFEVLMEDGTGYAGKTVLFATGERHRELTVPGEKEFRGKGVSYCATCDAPLYKNKKVLIIGGGNSAFTTALDLTRVNADITIVNFTKGWQADATLQQRIKNYPKAELLDYHEILQINGKGVVESAVIRERDAETEKNMRVDGIFIEIGLLPNSEPVKDLAELNKMGEVVVDCVCRTNIVGLFSAGDVTIVPYKQIVISAGEGAKAALAACDFLIESSQI